MIYIGTVSKGKVVLPPDAKLPEGAKVRVEPLQESAARDGLTDLLVEISREMTGLPEDLAEQHDHYLYGAPKR